MIHSFNALYVYQVCYGYSFYNTFADNAYSVFMKTTFFRALSVNMALAITLLLFEAKYYYFLWR